MNFNDAICIPVALIEDRLSILHNDIKSEKKDSKKNIEERNFLIELLMQGKSIAEFLNKYDKEIIKI